MEQHSLFVLPGFSNEQVEKQFLQRQDRALSKHDAQTYLAFATLWATGTLWLMSHGSAWSSPEVCQGLLGTLVWAAPWLLIRWAPELYRERRRLWVSAHRLACLLLPTTTDRLHRLPAAATSAGHLVGAVVLGAQLSRAWACSLGLRLDIRRHLALQVPQVAVFLGSKAVDFCTTPLIMNPKTLAQLESGVQGIMRCLGLLLPAFQWDGAEEGQVPVPAPAPEAQQRVQLQHCYVLLASLHLVLGVILPSIAVWIWEQRSRAAFLQEQAGSPEAGLGEVAQQLGLTPQEVLEAALFDPITAWCRSLALLLPLAALTWFGVLALSSSSWVALPWQLASSPLG